MQQKNGLLISTDFQGLSCFLNKFWTIDLRLMSSLKHVADRTVWKSSFKCDRPLGQKSCATRTWNKHMEQVIIKAPLSGIVYPIEQVPDPVFSQKMVGDGYPSTLSVMP